MTFDVGVAPGDCLLGKYRVDRVIGKGATSVVVAARHEQLRTTVALKILDAKDCLGTPTSRFLREARSAASLQSEHIARVTDVDVDELGRQFLVMELLKGRDLSAVIRDEGPLPIERAVGFVVHACAGVAEAHAAGILHRDLKPANLFLTHSVDGEPLVKILDFGVAMILDPQLRVFGASTADHGGLTGTPLYMSPEQLRQDAVDSRADIWSLGVILFELLTASRPFQATTLPEVIANILSDDKPRFASSLRADVPEALAAVVMACLEKDVAQRLPNAAKVAEALSPWTPPWADRAAARAQALLRPRNSSEDKILGEAPRPRPRPGTRRKAAVLAIAIGAAVISFATMPSLLSNVELSVAAESVIAPGHGTVAMNTGVASATDQARVSVLPIAAAEPAGPPAQQNAVAEFTKSGSHPARVGVTHSRLARRHNDGGPGHTATAADGRPGDPLEGRM
ncbi:MAG: serine/threonine-protein kinase [Myxococcales bacterium]